MTHVLNLQSKNFSSLINLNQENEKKFYFIFGFDTLY